MYRILLYLNFLDKNGHKTSEDKDWPLENISLLAEPQQAAAEILETFLRSHNILVKDINHHYDSLTSLEFGYDEILSCSIETNLEGKELRELLAKVKDKIGYCRDFEVKRID